MIYRPHRGYFVAELDLDDLREVYRIRDLLESEAVRVAVPQVTEQELAALATALDDVENASAAGDLVRMAEANRRFHFGLIEAAHLPRLSRLVRVLWDATDVYRSLYYADEGHRGDCARRAPCRARRRSGRKGRWPPSSCCVPTASGAVRSLEAGLRGLAGALKVSGRQRSR